MDTTRRTVIEAAENTSTPTMFVTVKSPDSFSGWKVHLRATDPAGTVALSMAVLDFVRGNGIGMKVATGSFHGVCGVDHPQHGKAVTLYLPRRAEAEAHIASIVRIVDGLAQAGDIAGDEMVAPNVGRRWELADGAPDVDLNHAGYRRWYMAAEAMR